MARPVGSKNKPKTAPVRRGRKPAAFTVEAATQIEDQKSEPTPATEEAAKPVEFKDVGVLDMRGMPIIIKAQLLFALQEEGYIWSGTLQPLLSNPMDLTVDAIKLNHVNKLIAQASSEDIAENSAVSTASVSVSSKIELSEPTSVKPAFIVLDGATYARVI